MRTLLRAHLTTILVAMVTAAVTAGAPAVAATIADYAKNADKVDGKHAVGAGASVADRAVKLVATNSAGRLPNNIIVKAPDADKLDGLDSTEFMGPAGPAGPPGPTGPAGPTGAPGVSGREVIRVTSDPADVGNYSKEVFAFCPAGKKVLGGGYDSVSGSRIIEVTASTPVVGGGIYGPNDGWQAAGRVSNLNGNSSWDWTLAAWVICATVT